MDPVIRPATRRDAANIAILVDIAGEGLASHLWRQLARPGQSPCEVGRSRVLRDEGSSTWRNSHVVEVDMEVAGVLIGYPLGEGITPQEIAEQSELVRPLMALEAEAPDHWYINVVSVFPEFRGQGLGTRLLQEAETLGRPEGPAGMAIIVSAENRGAIRLYERVGFAVAGRQPMVPYPGHETGGEWLLLTKPYA